MGIEYCAENKTFNIKTKNSSYVLGVVFGNNLVMQDVACQEHA